MTSSFCIPIFYDEKDIFFFFSFGVLEGLVELYGYEKSRLVSQSPVVFSQRLHVLFWFFPRFKEALAV